MSKSSSKNSRKKRFHSRVFRMALHKKIIDLLNSLVCGLSRFLRIHPKVDRQTQDIEQVRRVHQRGIVYLVPENTATLLSS
ncbi:hypothetical protein PUN28_001524 [Cardiocondyla obscurior]|uniref:Uncharacterized protein n=1 Tax=Cardiocondyla obscurior TaxID=286306 RepID=A0AAW2H5F5_9HYME